MKNSGTIAIHEIHSLFQEKTFVLLLAVFAIMTLASTFIGWSSQNTIKQIYSVAAEQMSQSGKIAPPSPFTNFSHLDLVKNMIIYVILIGGLLAINMGYSSGMSERKAGVVKLLFSRPIGKGEFLLGKLSGVSLVLAAITFLAAIINAVSLAALVNLTVQDMINLFSFYGISLIYLLGFAFLGLSSALVKEDEVVALLIPIIIWVAITFALPELTSTLYPTGLLNPTLPTVDIPQSSTLQIMHDAVYPFSISEHYKLSAAAILNISTDENVAASHPSIFYGGTIFIFMLLCLGASAAAIHSFDKSRG
jgi:ABC-type transport system involved in multi-copper enzyme maturation permease subunit